MTGAEAAVGRNLIMKVTSKILSCIHPDKTTCLLSGKNVKILLEIFKILDIHNKGGLNGKLSCQLTYLVLEFAPYFLRFKCVIQKRAYIRALSLVGTVGTQFLQENLMS